MQTEIVSADMIQRGDVLIDGELDRAVIITRVEATVPGLFDVTDSLDRVTELDCDCYVERVTNIRGDE